MKISVIGSGYVGLVTGAVIAKIGHHVTCIDTDQSKIQNLIKCRLPFFEPGLEEIIDECMKSKTLTFSTSLDPFIEEADIIIIAVGTPSSPSGDANLEYVFTAVNDIAKSIKTYKVIMIKSTVPVGTNEKITSLLRELTNCPFDVISVPEFLKEGSAVNDALNPERIIIGGTNERAVQIITELHRPMNTIILTTTAKNAEMIKYASNAFLATKISFINEIANICELVEADVTEVSKGMGLDSRIAPFFLKAGIGYGGSCFPKDLKSLIRLADSLNYKPRLLESVTEINIDQTNRFIEKVKNTLGEFKDKRITIWGLSFKPNTDDVRESASEKIIKYLIENGSIVQAYDPIATDNLKKVISSGNLHFFYDPIDAAINSDVVCILTDWDEFRAIDLTKVSQVMKNPVIIDGRNIYAPEQIQSTNIHYYSIGRVAIHPTAEKTNISKEESFI